MNHHTITSDPSRPMSSVRGGYTLIELLVASLLIASLMAATWNLMSMYSGFLVAGRAQAVEQQLARSLMGLFATDLRSVVPQHDVTPPTFSEVAAPDLTAIEPVEPYSPGPLPQFGAFESAGPAEEAAELPTEFFRGEEQSLTLIVSQSRPDWESIFSRQQTDGMPTSALDEAVALESGDLPSGDQLPGRPIAREWTQIIYRFEPPRAMLREDAGLSPGLHRFEIPIEYLGLLQQAGPLAGDESFTDESGFGDDESAGLMEMLDLVRERGVSAISHEHIPEVVACQFEFLGEAGWRSWWEDAYLDSRPQAVRIKIKLLPASEQQELMSLLGAETEATQDDEFETTETPETAAPSDAVATGSDPYARFHPQMYERTILLQAWRGDQRSQEAAAPGSESMSDGLFGNDSLGRGPLGNSSVPLPGGRP